MRLTFIGDPQVSPDGTRVLFAKKTVDEKKKYLTHLCTVDLQGSVQQWTQGAESAGNGLWSPDGKTISFVADRDKKGAQIYLLPTTGGEAVKLTDLPEGAIGGAQWSPDSKSIAFTFREPAEPFTKKAGKQREADGGATPPVEIDEVWYRLDGDGTFGNQRFKIYAVTVADGKFKEVYSGDPLGLYSFDWSPDSKELAVAHNSKAKPFIGLPDDQLYRVTLKGKVTKLKGLPEGSKSAPCWSPDGTKIAYIGDTHGDDPWGTRNRKLYVVSANGGAPVCLTEKHDYCLYTGTLGDTLSGGSSAPLHWSPDGTGVYCQIGSKGEQQLGRIGLDGSLKVLTKGKHCISLGNLSQDGSTFAATYTDPAKASEVVVLDLKKEAPL